ncbi:hypothetical protein [Bythopirellula goksoeyrii]|uniref:Uncharacterized protein n=1 Tax=Bythopirellula goksoeyrii TaxID=1400387 RepID=A0A5B9QH63_9BACT|nr:hypothetical protein [Bythopirellula goksoeyrii]QEG36910.1 hypothetical protein Pr1d_42500 [Bythopirellula goksoeyrii]
MIRCTPLGICSWNFDLSADGHSARSEFNWCSEQGALTIDGNVHEVHKHGFLSGCWTLDEHATVVVTAQKSSAFTRTFELSATEDTIFLRAASLFGRTMVLEGSGFDAVIAPVHSFTRRATIEGTIADFRIACFAFWLTALLWRRAANDNNTAGS